MQELLNGHDSFVDKESSEKEVEPRGKKDEILSGSEYQKSF